jgi:hypothetical protein
LNHRQEHKTQPNGREFLQIREQQERQSVWIIQPTIPRNHGQLLGLMIDSLEKGTEFHEHTRTIWTHYKISIIQTLMENTNTVFDDSTNVVGKAFATFCSGKVQGEEGFEVEYHFRLNEQMHPMETGAELH